MLRTTALPSGYPMLDGPELWGRLNLFAAADGYGAFDAGVTVAMDASAGGFNAADAWKNDISGPGSLVKQGSGSLTLSGGNSFRGGTAVAGGTLVAASPNALGSGPVQVAAAGTLAVTPATDGSAAHPRGDAAVRVGGTLEVAGTLAVTLGPTTGGQTTGGPVLSVAGSALLDGGSSLVISLPDGISGRGEIQLLSARQLRGTFGTVSVATSGYRAVVRYARNGVMVLVSP